MALIIKLVASCFYLGLMPMASGTFGSLFGLGIYSIIYFNKFFYVLVTLLFIWLGALSVAPAEKMFGQKDSKQIVIDEASGLLVAFFLIPPQIFYLIIGFLLYRFLDIIKPFPLRRLEKISSPAGIMLDDIGAGFYTNFILQCLYFLKHI